MFISKRTINELLARNAQLADENERLKVSTERLIRDVSEGRIVLSKQE